MVTLQAPRLDGVLAALADPTRRKIVERLLATGELNVGDVAALWQVKDQQVDANVKARVQNAVYSVIERQRFDGGFGLWTSDSPAENWLSSYAMEFLLRAKQQGYAVSDYALQQGLKWLDDYSRNYRLDDSEAIAGVVDLHTTRVDGVLSLGMWILPTHRGRGGGTAVL